MRQICLGLAFFIFAGCGPGEGLNSTSGSDANPAALQGKLPTPFGYVDASCAHQVADGTKLSPETLAATHCASPLVGPSNTAGTGTINGWVESAWGSSVKTPRRMSVTWTVPPPPTKYDGGIIFFFPSYEPADSSAIVQPVLQYGNSAAGGGAYWALASWYVSSDGTAHFTKLAVVQPGDVIRGDLVSQCDGDNCNVTISASDITSGASRSLTVAISVPFTSVQPAVLEAYGVTDCSELPGNGHLIFSGLAFEAAAGTMAPTFGPMSWTWGVDCGFNVDASNPYSSVSLFY
jgi:hypothetical protein